MKKLSEKDTDGKNLSGKKIKLLRINAGLSQGELAKALTATGCVMSRDTISQIENGTRFVFDFEILSFAQYFNVSINELISTPEGLDTMVPEGSLQ